MVGDEDAQGLSLYCCRAKLNACVESIPVYLWQQQTTCLFYAVSRISYATFRYLNPKAAFLLVEIDLNPAPA